MYALVDCNNFYASCEKVFNPKIAKQAVVVLSNNDGCIISRSDEAKELGIKLGTPVFKIENFLKQHKVNVFSSNYALYGDMSRRVMNILHQHAPRIEVYSIDEAFLDIKGIKQPEKFATNLATRVKKWTGIPVSIGGGPTKTLAKIANKIAPRGGSCTLITQLEINEVLKVFPVEKIWGFGRRISLLLNQYGIYTAEDLVNKNDKWIKKHLSITGLRTVYELRGTQCISFTEKAKARKNVSSSRSFKTKLCKYEPISQAIAYHAAYVAQKLRKQNSCGQLISIFLSAGSYKQNIYLQSRLLSFEQATNCTLKITETALKLLRQIYRKGHDYRKAGVNIYGIIPNDKIQQGLFSVDSFNKENKLMQAVDIINSKNGRDTIRLAAQGFSDSWTHKQEKLSPCYTPIICLSAPKS